MRAGLFVSVAIAVAVSPSSMVGQSAAPLSTGTLDYQFFKTRVEPIFLAKRPGHARCVSCHSQGALLRLQPLLAGRTSWTEEESRLNFDAIAHVVAPGNLKSKLLVHPLAEEAGRDFYHSDGKHFVSQSDPEWQTLKAFVLGATISAPVADHPEAASVTSTASRARGHVRILQTNSGGDNVHVIDPVTNTVVGVITGIEANHGVAVAPDGTRIYVSNESQSTLDIVDGTTFGVIKRIPLSGHPNNIAIGKDGRGVYVGIIQEPGGVDVIDTTLLQRVKTVPTKGTIHNPYVTPDGKYVVAGSIAAKTINVIDAKTEEPAWAVTMDLGIRPMAFSTNEDGSTKWIFAQLIGLANPVTNDVSVVDVQAFKEVARIAVGFVPKRNTTGILPR